MNQNITKAVLSFDVELRNYIEEVKKQIQADIIKAIGPVLEHEGVELRMNHLMEEAIKKKKLNLNLYISKIKKDIPIEPYQTMVFQKLMKELEFYQLILK
ncbi:MAG: hypothetical protein PHF86_03720 [Candidatus Nanoarchaeia archaeon]|nr:hypothetical protein [Candidatus Nanoarchaeia archaeon]